MSQKPSTTTTTTTTITRPLPHLPNELRIRILSFITDPHFLWSTCRHISPSFKQWSEEQYARTHLPKLKLAIDVVPQARLSIQPDPTSPQRYPHDKTEFLFNFASFKSADTSIATFRGDGAPWTRYLSQDRPRYSRNERDYELLVTQEGYTWSCQVMSEIDLGLRAGGVHHVCPCRSIRDQTKRGFCKRYAGVERYLRWNGEERVLEIRWKALLAYVYGRPCPGLRA